MPTVNKEELISAVKGIMPLNTKFSNEWALCNLHAWMENHKGDSKGDGKVPEDLLYCKNASVVCKWLCCFAQETGMENGYQLHTIRSLLSMLQ